MLKRLNKIIHSLKKEGRHHEQEISTTIDDVKEGKRSVFDKDRVNELLVKCGLLDKPEQNDESNEDQSLDRK